MGFIVLIMFIVLVFACFFSFIDGLVIGKKQAAAEYAEDKKLKIKSENDFNEIKNAISKGRFKK
jgi:hypothetical protein